jgi:hypothetical protein
MSRIDSATSERREREKRKIIYGIEIEEVSKGK